MPYLCRGDQGSGKHSGAADETAMESAIHPLPCCYSSCQKKHKGVDGHTTDYAQSSSGGRSADICFQRLAIRSVGSTGLQSTPYRRSAGPNPFNPIYQHVEYIAKL